MFYLLEVCPQGLRRKDTKNGESLDRIYKKKAENKKNEQVLPNPSPRVRKAKRLFFFTCIKLLPENQSFFLPLKTNFKPIK
ncbi:hypothetical protein B5F97_17045 [Bacteroides clarus]|uniref:Uncharacterized protein n=1 Tax=Bacteroides clarus TaxID=626929 RepID=A0A1Y3YL24_9BACE|nr:hypothetical protein B5F97_17045 [Bacteroides clarus]